MVENSSSWSSVLRKLAEDYLISSLLALILIIFLFNQRGAATSIVIASILSLVIFATAEKPIKQHYCQSWFDTFKSPVSLAFFLIIGLIGISQFWGVSEFSEWYRPLRLAFLFVCGTTIYAVVSNHSQKINLIAVVSVFLFFLALNSWLSSYDTSDPRFSASTKFYNRIIVSLVLISIILAAVIANARISTRLKLCMIAALTVLSAVISFQSYSQTSMLVWMAGWFLCLSLWMFPAAILRRAIVYSTSFIPLAMPFVVYFGDTILTRLANSNVLIFRHSSSSLRLDIWRTSLELIYQRPFAGWGLDPMKFYPEGQTIGELYPEREPTNFAHPHNAFLQIWLELGFLGSALLGLILFFLGREILKLRESAQPFVIAILVSCVLVMMVSHGIWQSWWVATLIFLFLWCTGFFRATDNSDGLVGRR